MVDKGLDKFDSKAYNNSVKNVRPVIEVYEAEQLGFRQYDFIVECRVQNEWYLTWAEEVAKVLDYSGTPDVVRGKYGIAYACRQTVAQ